MKPVEPTAASPPSGPPKQPPVELYMLEALEEKIIEKFEEDAWDALAYVAQWLQAVCGIRLKHLKIAFPCQLSGSFDQCSQIFFVDPLIERVMGSIRACQFFASTSNLQRIVRCFLDVNYQGAIQLLLK